MLKDHSWPKRDNRAFNTTREGAYFHMPSISTFSPPYASSFKEAADIVLDKCSVDGDSPENDNFAFPVLYLYRHGIELNLKSIIRAGLLSTFFERTDVEADLKLHNLAKLWNHARKILRHRWANSDPEPLMATEAVINELHQSDPNGQVFRYPSDKDGKRYHYKWIPDHISVAKLKETMDGVFRFLEATCSALEEDLQYLLG